MSRVLIAGVSPLPEASGNFLTGPSLRTGQIANGLAAAGHSVRLVCAHIDPETAPPDAAPEGSPFEFFSFAPDTFSSDTLAEHEASFGPDCIVAVGTHPALSPTARLVTDTPILFDLYGDVMSEGQVRARAEDDDTCVETFWEMLESVLKRGDVFAVVSGRQQYALMGLLGAAGRLNRSTCGFEFARVVPCSVPRIPRKPADQPLFRGDCADGGVFAVLFSGSFNTWVDLETVFGGVEAAMARDEGIRFVSTGGGVAGPCMGVHKRFLDMVSASEHRNRFRALGWIATGMMHACYTESDVAVNIDLPCCEAVLGSRNRILDWLASGLPVITTPTCELAQDLADRGLVVPVPHGDPEALAQAILDVRRDPARHREAARRGRDYVCAQFTDAATTESLLPWIASPRRAPDTGKPAGTFVRVESVRELVRRDVEDVLARTVQMAAETRRLEQRLSESEHDRAGLRAHAANLTSEREGLSAHARNLERERDEGRLREAEVKRDRDGLQRHAENLEQEVDNLKQEVARLLGGFEEERTGMRAEQDRGREDLQRAGEERDALAERLAETERERDEARAVRDDVVASRSYRIGRSIVSCLRIVWPFSSRKTT